MVWLTRDGDEFIAVNEFNTISARAAAIVAATILENRVEMAIRYYLREDDGIEKDMFNGPGPLATFSAKINLGYLMGLFTSDGRTDLKCIKDIRNDFAHETWARDFSVPSIKDRCNNLKLVEHHIFPRGTPEDRVPTDVTPKMYEDDLETQLKDPRKRYLLAIRFFTTSLAMPLSLQRASQPLVKPCF